MRQKILQLLRDNSSGYFSGEEMARMLGVSRTAIWKNIQSLLLDGYHIESSPRLGYRPSEYLTFIPCRNIKGIKDKIIASDRN